MELNYRGSQSNELPDTADGLVDRIQSLVPLIAENATKAEDERKPVDEVITALEATGVFKSFVPKRFGGYELDTQTFLDIGIAVSQACTSTGWVAAFYMEHNWMLAQFPPETQDSIFGQQPYILAPASITPSGVAEKVDGGYKINGRWGWGTGVMHADWVLLNGMVQGGDFPEPRLFIVPISDITVDDTWYSAGMVGTGSNDMVAKELFIPEARSESLPNMAIGRGSGTAINDSPRYKHPMPTLLSLAAATPAIGSAKRLLEVFQERLGGRAIYGTLTKQAGRQSAQVLLGNSTVQVQSAEILIRAVADQLDSWGHREEVCPPEERCRMRLQIGQAVQSCRDVVQNLMKASGAGAHIRPHPAQRILRDINTLSCHTVFDTDIGGENYGRIILGMDPASPV
ncbi:MAG: 3-hydroxy-9,10-secoandrosta-1,3,5(10)-triene-9,17-dione monooxygenase [Candidatus Azotimanducaceae bacterium]|jgi:3-hydroxy-9,10-secoandrosta-1,3,5(10)-triene-9,17-dione monooxygenase